MIYRIIAFFSAAAEVYADALALRRSMHKRYGWMAD
jgi:hypothetical protein